MLWLRRSAATAPIELLVVQAARAALRLKARTPIRRWLDDFNEAAHALRSFRRDATRDTWCMMLGESSHIEGAQSG